MIQPVQVKREDSPFRGPHSPFGWVDSVLVPVFHKYTPSRAWHPAINIYEDPSAYCVVVDLAGIQTEEVDLRVESGRLILSGQRATPEPRMSQGRVRMQLMEIDHGAFSRTLNLPQDADPDSISASYKAGFLRILLPKKD